MSTKINITVGDQKLLQESQALAAANRQALDERKFAAKQNEQLEQQVFAVAPEERNAISTGGIPRRVAAKRVKQKSEATQLYSIEFYNKFELPETVEQADITFDAVDRRVDALALDSVFTKTWKNSYYKRSLTWQPFFYAEAPSLNEILFKQAYTEDNCLKYFHWTYNQQSPGDFENPFIGKLERIAASIPSLPFSLENTKTLSSAAAFFPAPLASCDGENMYFSHCIEIATPGPGNLVGARTRRPITDKSAYDREPYRTFNIYRATSRDELVLGRTSGEYAVSQIDGSLFRNSIEPYDLFDWNFTKGQFGPFRELPLALYEDNLNYTNYNAVGIYWKYNISTQQGVMRIVPLSFLTQTYTYSAISGSPALLSIPALIRTTRLKVAVTAFLDNLEAGDPNRNLWFDLKTALNDPDLAVRQWLTTAPETKWPSHVVYSANTGVATAVVGADTAKVYKKNIGTGLSYTAAKALLPAVSSTAANAASLYTDAGWETDDVPITVRPPNTVPTSQFDFGIAPNVNSYYFAVIQ
jgi:hypothetical protein